MLDPTPLEASLWLCEEVSHASALPRVGQMANSNVANGKAGYRGTGH